MPPNIEVAEFFFTPWAYIEVEAAQQKLHPVRPQAVVECFHAHTEHRRRFFLVVTAVLEGREDQAPLAWEDLKDGTERALGEFGKAMESFTSRFK